MIKLNKVQCYSGYKANEKPKSFYIKDKLYKIKKILNYKYIEKKETKEKLREYKVICFNGESFSLIYNEKDKKWFLKKE